MAEAFEARKLGYCKIYRGGDMDQTNEVLDSCRCAQENKNLLPYLMGQMLSSQELVLGANGLPS